MKSSFLSIGIVICWGALSQQVQSQNCNDENALVPIQEEVSPLMMFGEKVPSSTAEKNRLSATEKIDRERERTATANRRNVYVESDQNDSLDVDLQDETQKSVLPKEAEAAKQIAENLKTEAKKLNLAAERLSRANNNYKELLDLYKATAAAWENTRIAYVLLLNKVQAPQMRAERESFQYSKEEAEAQEAFWKERLAQWPTPYEEEQATLDLPILDDEISETFGKTSLRTSALFALPQEDITKLSEATEKNKIRWELRNKADELFKRANHILQKYKDSKESTHSAIVGKNLSSLIGDMGRRSSLSDKIHLLLRLDTPYEFYQAALSAFDTAEAAEKEWLSLVKLNNSWQNLQQRHLEDQLLYCYGEIDRKNFSNHQHLDETDRRTNTTQNQPERISLYDIAPDILEKLAIQPNQLTKLEKIQTASQKNNDSYLQKSIMLRVKEPSESLILEGIGIGAHRVAMLHQKETDLKKYFHKADQILSMASEKTINESASLYEQADTLTAQALERYAKTVLKDALYDACEAVKIKTSSLHFIWEKRATKACEEAHGASRAYQQTAQTTPSAHHHFWREAWKRASVAQADIAAFEAFDKEFRRLTQCQLIWVKERDTQLAQTYQKGAHAFKSYIQGDILPWKALSQEERYVCNAIALTKNATKDNMVARAINLATAAVDKAHRRFFGDAKLEAKELYLQFLQHQECRRQKAIQWAKLKPQERRVEMDKRIASQHWNRFIDERATAAKEYGSINIRKFIYACINDSSSTLAFQARMESELAKTKANNLESVAERAASINIAPFFTTIDQAMAADCKVAQELEPIWVSAKTAFEKEREAWAKFGATNSPCRIFAQLHHELSALKSELANAAYQAARESGIIVPIGAGANAFAAHSASINRNYLVPTQDSLVKKVDDRIYDNLRQHTIQHTLATQMYEAEQATKEAQQALEALIKARKSSIPSHERI